MLLEAFKQTKGMFADPNKKILEQTKKEKIDDEKHDSDVYMYSWDFNLRQIYHGFGHHKLVKKFTK